MTENVAQASAPIKKPYPIRRPTLTSAEIALILEALKLKEEWAKQKAQQALGGKGSEAIEKEITALA
jgi:hypothetical protein